VIATVRPRALLVVTSAACLSLACWTHPQVVWSPDGRQAAVIAVDGLRVMDADGSLSPPLAAGVSQAVWFADSQRLALVTRREVPDFTALTASLGPERAETLARWAEILWQQFQAPAGPMDLGDRFVALTGLNPLTYSGKNVFTAIRWYLREHHGNALRQKLGESELEELEPITLNSLVMARLVDGRLELGTARYTDLDRFVDIRPAPGGQAVAFVTETVEGNSTGLYTTRIVSTDGGAPAAIVATATAGYPDWSPDGRSLLYLTARNEKDPAPEDYIGWLTEHEVLDAGGHIKLAESGSLLVRVMFSKENRVRSLANGLVMFNASERRFPAVAPTVPTPDHEQLFAFDREHSSLTVLVSNENLAQLPGSLAVFQPSPDSAYVLVGGDHADVWLIGVPDGDVKRFDTGFRYNQDISMPSWRQPGEFVFLRKGASGTEVVLRRGKTERVLSAEWPAGVLNLVPDGSRRIR